MSEVIFETTEQYWQILIWCFVNYLIVACVDGTYGQECIHKCSDNCDNDTCNVVSGLCVSGCRKGWLGPFCQQRKFTGFIISTYVHTVNNMSSMSPYVSNLSLMGLFRKQYKFDGSVV